MNAIKEFFGFGGVEDESDTQPAPTPTWAIDLQWVMSDKRGRRHVYRQLEQAGVYRLSYTGDDRTVFNEGQRNMGLMLLAEIMQHCSTEYLEMLKEHSQ